MRARNPICPRCKAREKAPKRRYCRTCEAIIQREKYKLKSLREKVCPLCGKKFVAPNKSYCPECSALRWSVRVKRMRELEKACEEKKAQEGRATRFSALASEAQNINWRYAWGSGIVGKQPEPEAPAKKELALSDFIGRDDEPSIWEHL